MSQYNRIVFNYDDHTYRRTSYIQDTVYWCEFIPDKSGNNHDLIREMSINEQQVIETQYKKYIREKKFERICKTTTKI